jgi:predicted nucleotidyltransferase
MNKDVQSTDPLILKQRAKLSIEKAKNLILEIIPNNEIVSIYIKGSFVQDELRPDSDVDVVVILKSEEYLPAIYKITEDYGSSANPPFQIVAYTMKELETGEKASNRIKNTTAVSRFVKHLNFLPLIYGIRPEGQLFSRTDLKDLTINIRNFRERFIPEYKEGKFKFKEIVKQVFWLVEGEQRLKGLKPGYSWRGLADSTKDENDIICLAIKYRNKDEISKKEELDFMKKLEEYLTNLESLS